MYVCVCVCVFFLQDQRKCTRGAKLISFPTCSCARRIFNYPKAILKIGIFPCLFSPQHPYPYREQENTFFSLILFRRARSENLTELFSYYMREDVLIGRNFKFSIFN